MKKYHLQAVISVPLIWQGQVKGVLQLRRSDPFTRRDLSQLTMFANHAAVAVENARLHESVGQELEERIRAEAALRESISIYRQAIEFDGWRPLLPILFRGWRNLSV